MSKTLLLTTDYLPARGGVARYLGALHETFSRTVDVRVISTGTRWWQAARMLLASRGAYDQVLVSHVIPLGTAAMVAGWFTRKPYVVIVHGMDVGFAKRSAIKRFVAGLVLRRAKVVVANSKALEREVRRDFDVTKTLVTYPVFSRAHGAPGSGTPHRPRSVQTSCPLAPGVGGPVPAPPMCLLTVARLVPRKGHFRVLDAMAVILREHPELDLTYTIIGDGPARAAIEARVAELGLSDRVLFLGNVSDDDLDAYYANADLFVMPVVRDDLDREGFGTVYLEAAAHGVPSVATDMPGVDEAVLQNETGILVPDGDIAALAEAVYGLSVDKERRERLGKAAQDRVLSEFTRERQFSKLSEFLS